MKTIKVKRHIILLLLTTLLCFATEPSRASILGDVANSMPEGTWAELKTNGFTPNYLKYPGGNNALSTQYMGEGTWDPITKQVLFLGSGHYNSSQLHFYTESSNTWTRDVLVQGQKVSLGHGYNHNTLSVKDRLLGFVKITPSFTNIYHYHIDNKTWRKGAQGPNGGGIAHALEYFPERGKWYVFDGSNGSIREYDYDSDTWSVYASKKYECFQGAGQPQRGWYHNFASYNPITHTIVFGGGNTSASGFPTSKSWCKMDADGVITKLPDAPTILQLPHAKEGGLITVDPVTGDLLVLNNIGKFYAFNFKTNTWSVIDDEATRPSALNRSSANTVDGFVVPINTYGVIMYGDYAGDKSTIWLYKHAQGGTPVAPPTAESTPDTEDSASGDNIAPNSPTKLVVVQSQNPPPPLPTENPPKTPGLPGAEFAMLCQQSTTIFCQDFNDPLPTDKSDLREAITSNDGRCEKLKSDPTKGCPEIVDGTLKFTVPSNSGSGGSGQYHVRFADYLNGQSIGPGQEVFIQWKQRFSASFLNTKYDPGAGWKQGMIGAADEFSCSSNEIVLVDTNQHGYPNMYHACGFNDGFVTRVGRYDFDYQPGGPGPCLRSDWPENSPTCVEYVPDEWMTFQVALKHGQPGEKSRVRLWVSHEEKPSILTIDFEIKLRNNKGYGKLWFLPYQTNKNKSQTHPVGYVWYDQLIISHTKLPD